MKFKEILISLSLLLSFSLSFGQEKRIESIDLYLESFNARISTVVRLNDLLSFRNFKYENLKLESRNAFTSFIQDFENNRTSKRLSKRRGEMNLRVAAIVHYSDKSNLTIASGTEPIIDFNGKVLKDESFNFLLLVNAQFDA